MPETTFRTARAADARSEVRGASGPSKVVSIATLIVCVIGCAGCKPKPRPTPGAPSATASAKARSAKQERARTSRVDVGMTEEQVRAIAGPADEIRHQDGKRPWISGASEAWAYGSREPRGFAFGGVVLFSDEKKVMMVRSPLDPVSVRAKRLRFRDTAEVDDRGLSCHLAVLSASPRGVNARVTLKNAGAAAFEWHDQHTGIRHALVVELFDEDKNLLAREDTLSLFSPHSPDDAHVMRIPAGGEIAEDVGLGATWSDLGDLPKGRYLIRVAFAFEVGRFSVSEPVPFTIGS
jgi:hypothetical protein